MDGWTLDSWTDINGRGETLNATPRGVALSITLQGGPKNGTVCVEHLNFVKY